MLNSDNLYRYFSELVDKLLKIHELRLGSTRIEFFGKTPLFFRDSGVNTANLLAKRRCRLYTDKECRYRRKRSGSTPLMPLFFRLKAASVANFDRR